MNYAYRNPLPTFEPLREYSERDRLKRRVLVPQAGIASILVFYNPPTRPDVLAMTRPSATRALPGIGASNHLRT